MRLAPRRHHHSHCYGGHAFYWCQLRQDGSCLSQRWFRYTYVGQELHPALGYITGWAMVMDYILNPLICTVIAVSSRRTFCPACLWALAIGFAVLFTVLNLRGIKPPRA